MSGVHSPDGISAISAAGSLELIDIRAIASAAA